MAVRRDAEIRVPFAIGPSGSISFTTDPVVQAAQHLISIIGTNPPERVMRPTYGTPVQDTLFEADDPVAQTELVTEIRDAVRTWAPDIEILRIDPRSSSYADGRVEYAVQFRLRDDPNIEEVVIEAGGAVTNA